MTWTQRHITTLRRILAQLYPRDADQRRVVHDAKLDETKIAFDAVSDNSWHAILRYADQQNAVDRVRAIAVEEFPDHELLGRVEEEVPPEPIEGPPIANDGWRGTKNRRAIEEQITGAKSALVPVSWLALGLERSRAVARLRLGNGSSGSAFLVAPSLLVTNHHVLPNAIEAGSAIAQFNYQQTMVGLDERSEDVRLMPAARFSTSAEDDWTIVALEGRPGDRWGVLPLQPAKVAIGDRVNIVQHPGGGYKQISFFANTVMFVGEGRVQYLTDTLPGSSGSPVFDDRWNVVALHRSGGWMREPGGDPKATYMRNEGILIDRVIEGMARTAPPPPEHE